MATLATPIQRSLARPAVPVSDPTGPALGAVRAAADTISQFAAARIEAQNADKLNTAQTDAMRRLNDLALSFTNDADPGTAGTRFADGAAKIQDELMAGLLDEPSRLRFQNNFTNLSEARRVDIEGDALRVLAADAQGRVLNSLDEYSKAAAQAKNPNERLAIMTQASDTLTGAVKSRIMRAPQAARLGQEFKEKLALLDARRAVDADPQAALKLLRKHGIPDLDPLQEQQEIERAEAEIEARKREARAAMAERRADAREALSDLDTINASGLPIDKATSDRVAALVRASGDRGLADRYNRSVRVSNFLTGMRGMNPAEAQAVLSDLEERANRDGADVTIAAGAIAARRYVDAMGNGLREDPLMYAQAQGRAAIEPLDMAGQNAPEAWKARATQAERVADHYGTRPVYLTKAETQSLKSALAPEKPVAQRLEVARALVKNLGRRSLSVFASIAPDDPVVANAGALMLSGNETAARDALNGQGLLRNGADGKQTDLRPTPAGRNSLPSVSALSVATGLAGQSGRGQILSTADAIFASRAALMGVNGAMVGQGDRRAVSLYERALNEAAGARYDANGTKWGGLAEFNGVPVVAPRGIPADSFEDAIHGLSDRALTTHSVSGAPPMVGGKALAAKDLRRLFPISVGDGLYALSTTDPRQGVTPVLDGKGKPYKFSLLNALDNPGRK